MTRKRKLVTGIVPLGRPSLKSRKEARKVTASYHIIQNELSAIDSDVSLSASARSVRKSELEGQLEEIGGIDRYQEASQISTQHFKTSRWVLSQIAVHHSSNGNNKEQGQRKKDNEEEEEDGTGTATNTSCSNSGRDGTVEKEKNEKEPKPKVLEVGAINIQLQQVSHLDVRSIDINSQHPSIEEMNFFDIEPECGYDVVVCSMVVNCVHEVARRGEMLARLRMHLRTAHKSLLLLVLPSRCIRSKHLGAERFLSLCTALGMAVVEVKETPRLLFYTLRATSGASSSSSSSSAGWVELTRAALGT
jgi:hypothetical protein